MHAASSPYLRHRFPAEIISHTVWLYFRFALSFRDVEEIMRVRGVTLTYEAIREWCRKFGQTFANGLRRRRPRPGERVASGGDVHPCQWQGSLSVAGRRPGWQCAEHPGAKPQEQKGRQAVLPQATEGFAVRPKSDHHRHAEELQRGEGSGSCQEWSTNSTSGLNNRAENRAPAGQSTRESHETVQVGGACESASCRHLGSSPRTSDPDDIYCQPSDTGKR